MAYYFNEAYYIKSTLAQLKSTGQTYTEEQLLALIAQSGLTTREHYEQAGRAEGLNPNPYFNEYEYLLAKTRQLNSIGEENRFGGGPWTVEQTLRAILEDGMIPAEHYERFGCYETDATGRYINPSNAFDANAYWSAKLYQLQATEPDAGWTMASMLAAFQRDGLSPVSHYAAYGHEEVTENYAFVQTVPVGQRMSNDPLRDDIGDTVPTNYMSDTPRPRDGNARPAEKPADVGGLVDETLSPTPVYPEKSAPVGTDDDYIAPPSTIKDGYGVNVIPPSTSGTGNASDHFIVVDDDSDTGVVVHRETGAILGQVNLEKTTVDGRTTAALPEEENLPEGWLFPTDKNELPPGCDPDYSLNNNFTKDPVTDETGITAAFNANDWLVIDNTVKETGSSVTLDEDGYMSWTGYRYDAVKPTDALEDGNALVARDTTEAPGGTGILTLTTHKTGLHALYGSFTVRNHILVQDGAQAIVIAGGEADDTITVAKGAVVDSLFGEGGDDEITVHGTVTGGIYGDGGAGTDSGNDVITIAAGGTVGNIIGGSGDDVITIAAGATVGNFISGNDGDDEITVHGTVEGGIYGGGGNDIITIATALGNITGSIDGGAGQDTLVLAANYAWDDVEAKLVANSFEALTVATGAEITNDIFLGEVNANGVTCTVEKDGTANGPIWGSGGSDIIILKSGATAGGIDGGIDGGGGNDIITIESGATMQSNIFGGAGHDKITVSGTVIGNIYGSDGDDEIIVSGTVEGGIDGGVDNDIITIESGATVDGGISGGMGNDIITLATDLGNLTGALGAINGGAGQDTLVLDADYAWADVANKITNFEAVTVAKNGNITGTLSLGGVDGGGVYIVESGGQAQNIQGGANDDAIIILGGGTVGSVNGGSGNDTITLHSGATVEGSAIVDSGTTLRVLAAGSTTWEAVISAEAVTGAGKWYLEVLSGTKSELTYYDETTVGAVTLDLDTLDGAGVMTVGTVEGVSALVWTGA